jgi:cyclomaltodextrinase
MKNTKVIILQLLLILFITSCGQNKNGDKKIAESDLKSVPEWSKNAIWYQIFVERFRNGDTTNDPTVEDMKGGYPDKYPDNWKVTSWGHDWYAREPWVDKMERGGFYSRIQARRYGGDLQGVLDKMDYLQSLGVNVIYFNPLNDSPSLHKYDARNWTHIDRNFGPDPKGDIALIAKETPDDPKTWVWTSADKLFLKVIDELHKRGIRVIMDYSWNHTGKDFWALNDIMKNGEKSRFKDWYNIIQFDNPSTPENEFKYEGWGGGNIYMPVVKKDIIPPDDKEMPFEGNLHSESLKKHIFDVSRRWLDPDGNGDHSDGIDGFRLDVAGEVPMGFWREYRKVVRSVNPEAYIVGEIWWLKWPDKLLDPEIYMGDQFDAIMNYRWFRIARGFFGQAEPILKPSEFVAMHEKLTVGIGSDYQQAMMNIVASHDAPRLSTSLYNKTMDKYNAKPSDNPDYKINKPDELTLKEQKLLLVHQYTFVGAPHIWNGDEVGMWGADDPDCRKPLVWDDLKYEDEKANFDPAKPRPVDVVKPDKDLFSFYQELVKMRKENPVLSTGDLKFLVADDEKMVLAYSRSSSENEIIAVFNRSGKEQTITLEVSDPGKYKEVFKLEANSFKPVKSSLVIILQPVSAIVLRK